MKNWTIIKVTDGEEHSYYSLHTGGLPLNPNIDIELENEIGDPEIIEAGTFEIMLTGLTGIEADEFIDMEIQDQDEFIKEYA